ncbi:hypothetical protein K1719_046222 [Acacia pycnantha]|nr:hypothetical protein K1719_046222 [Acacia pycnantha]
MPHGASSSSITDKWSYDVYLSCCREDLHYNFTILLQGSLLQTGLSLFIGGWICCGGDITSLFKDIHESRIAIIVFSKNYANSSFCLQELVQILECFKKEGRLIYPVFYDVDPSEIRHQTGSYAEALARLEKRFIEKRDQVEKWRWALSQAADLTGFHFLPKTTNVRECIRVIDEQVTAWINETDFSLWEKEKLIGSGAYGEVYVARNRKTGALCGAVKELNLHRAKNDKSIRHEIEILSQLKYHSNIVKYYGHKEIRRGQNKYQTSHEALTADIWSLGCVVIEMFSGCSPNYDSDSDSEIPHIPEELCEEGKDFLKRCFRRKPADRPSAKELLEHLFVTKRRS